jgi:hypothetical protein
MAVGVVTAVGSAVAAYARVVTAVASAEAAERCIS